MKIRPAPLRLSEPVTPFRLASAAIIENQEQLSALRPALKRLLINEYSVSGFADKLFPVERADGCISIFARQEYVGSDQADALEQKIKASGKLLSIPARYVLSAGLLLSLARSRPNYYSMVNATSRSNSALAGVFHDLVQSAVQQKATDIHINIHKGQPISEVRFTVAGRYLQPQRFSNMPTGLLIDMLSVAWMDIQGGNGAVFDPTIEQQGALEHVVDGVNYILRWASLAADIGPSVCLRLLRRDKSELNSSLEYLGYSQEHLNILRRVLLSDSGAIVFAGTVGSGKSTSLAVLLGMLPDHRKIISIEEPIEYRINGAIQNTIGRSLEQMANQQYAAKLRTLKRSAMTDVLLGEIRDQDSGLAFMDLTGSGVNVYTTVHAPSAYAIVKRLASSFIGIPYDFLITPGVLKLLIYQALLPQLCPYCALNHTASNLSHPVDSSKSYWLKWLCWIENHWHIDTTKLRFKNPQGCKHCFSSQLPQLAGYVGRTVVAEIIEPGIYNNLYVQADHTQSNNLIINDAMGHAMQKASAGLIDVRDIEERFIAMETLHHFVAAGGQLCKV